MFSWAAAVSLVFGFLVGYAVRESISRRRRAAARAAADEEGYRELDSNQTLPRPARSVGKTWAISAGLRLS